ncbi:MAG: acetyl/propionyl/methylcrotonyl-CoA carboxylase subunit alpha [Planctomycetota bacterium]
MFRRILVANRGEIALRILRSARESGASPVAVYSDADRGSLHVRLADEAIRIGPPAASESYLRGDLVLEAALRSKAEAVHPGYGFLAENADFAGMVRHAGLAFIGPSAAAMDAMGDKLEARRIAADAGLPVIPGTELSDAGSLTAEARRIGFPVMLKAAAGGGGKGIRIVAREEELAESAALAAAEARSAFGDDRIYLEKFLSRPRHIEVQVFADRHGNVVTYGERECSVQRRHQKLIEESPSPVVGPELRGRMEEAALSLARAADYEGAGTVEFMVSEGEFYFLEMNTRLQVEHAITEERYGVDLVQEQLRVAAGERLSEVQEPRGHSIEVRINAEDPATFLPSLGTIRNIAIPGGHGVRFDSAMFPGLELTPYYDSMLGKIIVHAPTRKEAVQRMLRALTELRVAGVKTSVPVAVHALRSGPFQSGDYDTSVLDRISPEECDGRAAHLEVAAVAVALARYKGLGANAPPVAGFNARQMSPWVRTGRDYVE